MKAAHGGMALFNWERLTYKRVAIAIVIFATLDWAMSQFVIFPRMTPYQRASIETTWRPGIGSYVLSLAFICLAMLFVTCYKGSLSTHKNRMIVFAMAIGTACGLVLNTVMRLTGHF